MVHLTTLSKNSYRRATWKNGLGHTDEIAIHPPGSDLRRGDFLFRLSSARIELASPFSPFPAHDRALVILDGAGVRLTHTFTEGDEEESIEIPPFEPYEFPGDVPSRCELIDGPVTDLSVMIRKAEVEAITEVIELEPDAPYSWIPAGRWNFLFAADTALEITSPIDGKTLHLAAGDTLRADLDAPLPEGSVFTIQTKNGTSRAVLIGIQG